MGGGGGASLLAVVSRLHHSPPPSILSRRLDRMMTFAECLKVIIVVATAICFCDDMIYLRSWHETAICVANGV